MDNARELFLCYHRTVGPDQVRVPLNTVTDMDGVYELTLRARSGQERRTLVWFSTAAVRQDYQEKCRKRGIEITDEIRIL